LLAEEFIYSCPKLFVFETNMGLPGTYEVQLKSWNIGHPKPTKTHFPVQKWIGFCTCRSSKIRISVSQDACAANAVRRLMIGWLGWNTSQARKRKTNLHDKFLMVIVV